MKFQSWDDDIENMVVLRKKAEEVIRWWDDGRPIRTMEGELGLGLYFSMIVKDKLVDKDFPGVSSDCLHRRVVTGGGVFEGEYCLDFGTHIGNGGVGCILMCIDSVSILDGFLVFSGRDKNCWTDENEKARVVEYRYRIQEEEGRPQLPLHMTIHRSQTSLEAFL